MKLQVGNQYRQHEMYEHADYRSFWEGAERCHLDRLEKQIIQEMLRLPAHRLIDIGCGFGRLSELYLYGTREAVLLDSSLALLRQAQEATQGQARYVACDLMNFPFIPGSFDRVMCIRVLHHLADGSSALKGMTELLAPQGQILLTFCNKKNIERVWLWLTHRNPYNPYLKPPATVWNAFQMHHPTWIESLLEGYGCSIDGRMGSGILDKLIRYYSRLGWNPPSGYGIARLAARLALAPWIFISAKNARRNNTGTQLSFHDILVCPTCRHLLDHTTNRLICDTCQVQYPIVDGIINLLTPERCR